MKKKLLILLVLLLIPMFVNAEEYCTIISGDGKNIGDEIACGDEHFYVIENDGTNTKMLAKYNLDVGYIYYKEDNYITDSSKGKYENCEIFAKSKGAQEENYFVTNDESSCMYFVTIDNKVIQSSKAIGAHGDTSGKPEFPEYGIVRLTGEYKFLGEFSSGYGGNHYYDGKLIEITESERIKNDAIQALNDYKEYLKDYEIKDANLITVSEINKIVKTVSGKDLPLEKWYNDGWQENNKFIKNWDDKYYYVGSIKDYISSKYSWLWSTTYWTRTSETNLADNIQRVYFIDTLGYLCNGLECRAMVGAGVRPVITIANTNVLMEYSSSKNVEPPKEEVKNPDSGAHISYIAIAIIFVIGIIAMLISKRVNKKIKI